MLLLSLLSVFFNYYDLALKRCSVDDNFTIHGLWPEWSPTKWPVGCTDEPFNMSLVKPLEGRLLKEWYSCIDNPPTHTNETFWSHEWSKHGTCTNFSQYDYFNQTLTLFERYDTRQVVEYYCGNSFDKECLIPLYLNESLMPRG